MRVINNYNKLIIVISSPSGAETSVCKELISRDKQIGLSISDTTRPARDNEKNGVDYNFIKESEFLNRAKNNAYIEFANVFGNFYGSQYNNIINNFDEDRDILFDIDWQGAEQLKNYHTQILYRFSSPLQRM